MEKNRIEQGLRETGKNGENLTGLRVVLSKFPQDLSEIAEVLQG